MTDDTTLRERREVTVLAHMQAENVQDWEAVMATFAPGRARYELIAAGEVHDGPDEVMAYWRAGRTTVPDQTNELLELWHTDDGVWIEFRLTGTPIADLNPQQRSFDARLAALFTFEPDGDLITGERVYWDRATILDQLA